MKLYKTARKLASYALISTASLGVYSCREDKPAEKPLPPSPLELGTSEQSQFVFEKSNIESSHSYWSYGNNGAVTCGDLNGDGALDIIIATEGGITIYENKTPQKRTNLLER